MKVIKPYFEEITTLNEEEILKKIETVGRTCYKSENKITKESAANFVKMLIKSGHESMIEHENISVKIICDRGVSHEWVRHRLASYAQESTRYCNYSKNKFDNQLTFIQPCWFREDITGEYKDPFNINTPTSNHKNMNEAEFCWFWSMAEIERNYLNLIKLGWKPEQARSILPNSLKTELIVTMNLREWRHFFNLRTNKAAHPQIREISLALLQHFQSILPIFFNDIEVKI